MEIKEYQPRIVRGRTELWVPHNAGEIAFASPAHGPGTYQNVGKSILDDKQKVPTGDYMASLLHSAYCNSSVSKEPEFVEVKQTMKNSWLWVYNRNLWTDKGVYVLQDEDGVGRSKPLEICELEAMLATGKKISGIRFSSDGRLRFAPKESYNLGEHTSESFAKDGFVIASSNLEGARKFGEVASRLRNRPYVYGLDIKEGQSSELRVSAVNEDDDRLRFDGGSWYVVDLGHAFGVWN